MSCAARRIFPHQEFAAGSDYLFIEAMFLRRMRSAQEKYHLTARQAGSLARAGVTGNPFHFSPKYTGQGDELRREVEDAFRGQEE
jgi:ribonuclease Z